MPSECQQKKIELALAVERLEKQSMTLKIKTCNMKQRSYAEKDAAIEKNNALEKEILLLEEKIREQSWQNQQVPLEEHVRHEQSEDRWVND